MRSFSRNAEDVRERTPSALRLNIHFFFCDPDWLNKRKRARGTFGTG